MVNKFISIGELSRRSGISAHTLRFYESKGILKPAARGANGHRRYFNEDVVWLEFVLRLKQTGMPLAEIRQYAILRVQGEMSLSPRLAMLTLHRQRLTSLIQELSTCMQILDNKINTYRQMIAMPSTRTNKVAK